MSTQPVLPLCRTCAGAVDLTADARGTCRACWQKRVLRFLKPRQPGQPLEGPLARVVCLTLGGLLRQAELRREREPLADADRLLAAAADGRTLHELGDALGLDVAALLPLVQANLDGGLLELAPEIDWLAAPELAPELAADVLAPVLGGDRREPIPAAGHIFQAAPPVSFKYPARTPVPRAPFEYGRHRRRR